MIPSRQHVIVISALLLSTISAQFVSPNPISGCNGGVDAGIVTCSNQGGCCSGGAACCAGGCCPTTAWCVNEGLPNEGCCDLNDPTWCQGSKGVPPLFSQTEIPSCTATTSLEPQPSVQCTSENDEWSCPPGTVCGLDSPVCHDFYISPCESVEVNAMGSPVPAATPITSTGSQESTTLPEKSASPNGTAPAASPTGGANPTTRKTVAQILVEFVTVVGLLYVF